MKNVHPCTFFIDEFEAKPQTSLLRGTSGIHAAFACEVEQQRAVEQCTSVYTFSRHTSVYVGKRQVLCTKLASD